jgi:predicted HTH transcriptional regulator
MNKLQESFTYNPKQVQLLRKLVSAGEGSRLEFKRKATNPERIVREMIAFANTKGGILLLGIGDDGTIPGLKFPEDEVHVMTEALQKVRPPLKCVETLIPIGNARTVIQYEIPESNKKPHYLVNGELLNGELLKESFVRVEDKSIKASREVREIIRRDQQKKDIKFWYAEHEKFLMEYLDKNISITLAEFVALSGLKKFYASKKLIILVLADVLRVTPNEKGDVFMLAFGRKK